jgi:trimeric autotransporter adhesin
MSSNIQPTFVWQEGRQFDGRSQHVVVPHDPKWLLDHGVVLLDFTADRLKGVQGLLSKDAKGFLDGGHLCIWLDEGKVVVRVQDKKSEYVVQSPPNTVKKGGADSACPRLWA